MKQIKIDDNNRNRKPNRLMEKFLCNGVGKKKKNDKQWININMNSLMKKQYTSTNPLSPNYQ